MRSRRLIPLLLVAVLGTAIPPTLAAHPPTPEQVQRLIDLCIESNLSCQGRALDREVACQAAGGTPYACTQQLIADLAACNSSLEWCLFQILAEIVGPVVN